MKVVTFGELMVRMPEAGATLANLNTETARFGGSEANAAVSLATLGDPVVYVTRLPDIAVGHAAANRLATYGVDTTHVLYKGERMGSYFLQQGASRQKSKTIYDRDNTAYSTLRPGDIPWREILQGTDVFHTSGICPAISQSAADTVFEAIEIATEMGIKVSLDINYRKALWQYGVDARTTLIRMMQQADIMFGDVLEYEFICQREAIPFSVFYGQNPDLTAYKKWFEELHELCPRCSRMMIGIRNQIDTTHHELTALLLADGKMVSTVVQDITNIVDPVGVGDAFAAGSIHAALHFSDDTQRWLDYSLAAATLKNRVRGDFNLSTNDEIEELLQTSR